MSIGREGAPIVAVGGGKGGVGKSVIAANLGVAMARLGFRTLIVDADLGAANQHTLFGIDRPGPTLQALVDRRIESLEEAVLPTGIPRLFLVPGSGAVAGAANIGHARKQKIMRHIRALEAEALIIDCGAGTSFDVVDFFGMADQRLLVVAPQLTSMQNAYAFLKSAVYRLMKQVTQNAREKEALASAVEGRETERLREVFARLRSQEPELEEALALAVGTYSASIVGNMLEQPNQRAGLVALSRMMEDFLSVEVPVRGVIELSKALHHSVTRRRPLLAESMTGSEADTLMALAEELITHDVSTSRRVRSRDIRPDEDVELDGPLAKYLRRHPRVPADVAASLEVDGQSWPARLLDLSQGGARVSCGHVPELGAHIVLRLPDYPGRPSFPAIVRNQGAGNGRVGIQFDGETATRRAVALVQAMAAERKLEVGSAPGV
ncbi:MAG: P-loop NTPase [Deltaproteobacteria bacterium]|nr:P-loop NTPase [Deltaproteobacteria bacterium]